MSRADERTFEKFCAGFTEEQTAALEEMLDRLLQNTCGGCGEEE